MFCRNCFQIRLWLKDSEWGFGVWDWPIGSPVRYLSGTYKLEVNPEPLGLCFVRCEDKEWLSFWG